MAGQFGDAFRILVVDDGSRDRTGAILDELAPKIPTLHVIHQINGGHGKALLRAYKEGLKLQPEYVFHVDSDDQFHPEDFEKLWTIRNQSPFLLGYRLERHDAFHRWVITRVLRAVLFSVFGSYLRDSNVPFRLVKASYLRGLLNVMPKDVFAPKVFLSVLAARDKKFLGEIPIGHVERKTGKVSIVRWRLLKACLRCVRELVAFRLGLVSALSRLQNESV